MKEENKDAKTNNNKIKDEKAAAAKEDAVTIPRREYEELKTEAKDKNCFYEKYIRASAEFENARKRLEKDKQDFLKFANENFVLELLPILDNLEIAEKHIKEAKDFKAVQEGVDMIQGQIQKFLKDVGVERIKSVGERFDPNQHDAIEIEDASDKADGLIVAELKPGYRFNGKLLRPASVRIVKKK